MRYISPESAGISSGAIARYVKLLEEMQLSTHDLIFMKGDAIFFEKYWAPFHKDFLHRMYSVTKSFVSLAIGFAAQDGYLALDDPIEMYFPAECKNQPDQNMRRQTIRHMLMMSTAKPPENWFAARSDDRVRFYFENAGKNSRPSGTVFEYDSTGSFVLCALVERLTQKPFMEYLREKLFDKIGVSKEAHCLKCPGGHSWGDSAALCKATDLLKIARFTMNKGKWNGEQLLDEAYVTAATAKQIDNNPYGLNEHDCQGYGYLIWRTFHNAFFFNGMGCQFAVCVPDLDLIMVYNGDNQGKEMAKKIIIDHFFSMIADEMADAPLAENAKAQSELAEATANLMLMTAQGERESLYAEKINGVTYVLDENPMGISKLRVVLDGDNGRLEYTNAQGDKVLYFGMGKNAFGKFPQEGYAKEIGSVRTKNHYYRCAASGAWVEEHKLFIKVQIIDDYFGVLNITLSFLNDTIGVLMNRCAEDFLEEYEGFAGGKREK